MQSLGSFLSDLSLWLILAGLALTQLGVPVPETVFIVAAGIVSHQSGLPLLVPTVACCVAVLTGDLVLFYLARAFGPRAFERRSLRWVLPPRALPRIDALFAKHGAMTIFVARFISGVRAATFVLAGMRRMPLRQFLIWDGAAVLLTVPPFAVIGFLFANSMRTLQAHVERANLYLLVGLVLAVGSYVAFVVVRWRRKRVSASADREDGHSRIDRDAGQ
jgi:membrane protein DedA with SNARE-associated domain